MPMLDVFKADSFNTLSLTTAVNKLPYKPARLGSMNLFKKSSVTTTTITVEEQDGKIVLVPNQGRGSLGNVLGGVPRKTRAFNVTNLPLSAAVMADDVQNIRSFGSETEIQTVSELVNDKLSMLRQSMEFTHEFHRIGAIKGVLLDADGTTTIYDWATEFTGAAIAVDALDFTADGANAAKKLASRLIRKIQDALGMATYDHVHVMCGSTFFDTLIAATEVKTAYERWRDGQFLRDSQVRLSFEYGGVTWEEYRGKVGATPFIAVGEAYAFPVGAEDVFAEVYAPAFFNETVNTKGKPIYAKQEPMNFDIGINLLALSCPLIYCARPATLRKLTVTGTPV